MLAAREEAFIAGLRGDLAGMESGARAVLAQGESLGLRFVVMQAWQAIGYAVTSLARFQEGAAALRCAVDIAVEDGKVYRATTSLATLAWWQGAMGSVAAGRDSLARAKTLNPSYRDSIVMEQEVLLGWMAGDVRGALASARECVAWAPGPQSLRRRYAMAYAALAALDAGAEDEATMFLDRAQAFPDASTWSPMSALSPTARGVHLARRGQTAEALASCRSAATWLREIGGSGWSWEVLAAEIAVAADAQDLAAAQVAAAELASTAPAGPGQQGLIAWANGVVALLEGDRPRAAAAAREALAAYAGTDWAGRTAQAWHLLGGATEDRAEAVAALDRAAAMYEKNGAQWPRGRVLADLRRLGGAGRRAADAASGPTSLTAREREVATLAAEGLSAREIAGAALRRRADRGDPPVPDLRQARRGVQARPGQTGRRAGAVSSPYPQSVPASVPLRTPQVQARSYGRRGRGHRPAPATEDSTMTDFETRRQDHVRHALELLPELAAALDWPAERIAAERDARLRALVTTAVERSPWHRKRLAGIDLGAPGDELLAALPVMTKDDLMANFDDVVTDPAITLAAVEANLAGQPGSGYLGGRHTAIASGGSSGRRGCFVYDWTEFAILYVGLWRYLLRVGLTPGSGGGPVMAAVAAGHPTHGTAAFARTFTGPHLPMHRLPVNLPLAELVDGLNALGPEVLAGYPSALHLLTEQARRGRLRIRPRRVITYAEPLLPEARSAIEDTWGLRVGNLWGASEAGPLGIPCDHGNTHLSEDLLIIEPVDATGAAVPPGTSSAKVYLTNLYLRTMPLIRYEITDEVLVLAGPCPCGSAHRCVADVQGRLDDSFDYRGLPVHPFVFRGALGERPQIVEYQVRQTERGADIDLRVTGALDTSTLVAGLEDALRRLGLADPAVQVRVVTAIERGQMGKLKRFVPLPAAASSDFGGAW